MEPVGHDFSRRNSGIKEVCSSKHLSAGRWAARLLAGGRRQRLERRARCQELVRSHDGGKWNYFLRVTYCCGSEQSLHFPVSFHSEAERYASFWSQNILIVKRLVFSHNFDRIWILGVIFQRALQKADSVSSQGKFLSGKHPSDEFPVQGHILRRRFNFPVVCDI